MLKKKDTPVGISEIVGRHFEKYLMQHKNGKIPEGVYDRVLREVEEVLISVALKYTDGNQLQAAKILGINRNTLHRKMMKFKLDDRF